MILAKTDLTTELVKEFTELQGQVGGLYACSQGLGERFRRPSTTSTLRLRLTMIFRGPSKDSCWAWPTASRLSLRCSGSAGPTGSKDPFALRRAANSIVKILAESELPLTLSAVLKAPAQAAGENERGRGSSGMRDSNTSRRSCASVSISISRMSAASPMT